MKRNLLSRRLLAALVALGCHTAGHAAAFVYEGELSDRGVPANGRYDLRITPVAEHGEGRLLAPEVRIPAIEVRDGRFRAEFELPGVDAGAAPLLEVAVRDAGSGEFTAIPGRSKALAAIGTCWSSTGDSGSNPATNFLGTTDAQPLNLKVFGQKAFVLEPSTVLSAGKPVTANVVAGGPSNTIFVGVRGATIAGGGSSGDPDFPGNTQHVTDAYGTVGGGGGNIAGDSDADEQDEPFATVAGGTSNSALRYGSFVGGGKKNVANSDLSAVLGGQNNLAEGDGSSVLGGEGNGTAGDLAVVSGGTANCAGGVLSWAGGTQSIVRTGAISGGAGCLNAPSSSDQDGDEGTFAWSGIEATALTSTGPNQFIVRASGGVAINTPPVNTDVELTITSDSDGNDFPNLFLRQKAAGNPGVLISAGDAGAGVNNAGFYIDHYNGTDRARRLALNPDGSVIIRSNTTESATGVTMAVNAGAWSNLSDRSVKTAIEAIDPATVLDRLVAMPVTRWSYIAQGEGIRHLGPMAQDFAAAFGLGEDDTHISTIDADGVALAAIQGLAQQLREARTENETLRERLERVEARLDAAGR